jgi:hypothetical protein
MGFRYSSRLGHGWDAVNHGSAFVVFLAGRGFSGGIAWPGYTGQVRGHFLQGGEIR